MVIVYASRTGNVKRFVSKINQFEAYSISDYDSSLGEYVLITFTTGFGSVPEEVKKFLQDNHSNMVAVASSGNRNWGAQYFGRSGDIISEQYSVPLIYKFELSGSNKDVEELLERIERLGRELHSTQQ